MKMRLGDLRRIIRETAELGRDLAAVVKSTSGGIKVTVYDPVAFEDLVLGSPEVLSAGPKALMGCVVGRVRVVEPADPCWDAMMIASVAGPGKLMYGLAYALSPSGLLISDRDFMTTDAISAWRDMSAKISRGKKKLDDVTDPKTPEPEDDCALRPEEFLNYAYESEGWEQGVLSSMQAEHEQLVKRLTTGGDVSRGDIERSLMTAGHEFFQKELDTAVKRQEGR